MKEIKELKEIIDKIKKLSQREKVIVGGAGFFIVCLLCYFVVISPAQERSKHLSRLIIQKERELRELVLVSDEYQQLKAAEDEIVRRISTGGGISPLSQLEQLAQNAGLREQLEQMKPLPSIATPRYVITPVQLDFKGAELQELVAFLYEIESDPLPYHIKRLKLKPTARTAGRLDLTMEILTYSVSSGT